jgi:hypothetical protein
MAYGFETWSSKNYIYGILNKEMLILIGFNISLNNDQADDQKRLKGSSKKEK